MPFRTGTEDQVQEDRGFTAWTGRFGYQLPVSKGTAPPLSALLSITSALGAS